MVDVLSYFLILRFGCPASDGLGKSWKKGAGQYRQPFISSEPLITVVNRNVQDYSKIPCLTNTHNRSDSSFSSNFLTALDERISILQMLGFVLLAVAILLITYRR